MRDKVSAVCSINARVCDTKMSAVCMRFTTRNFNLFFSFLLFQWRKKRMRRLVSVIFSTYNYIHALP